MSDDFQRGLQARLAHLIGEASQWSRGSGAHPPGLVRALNEAFEYGCAEIERLQRARDELLDIIRGARIYVREFYPQSYEQQSDQDALLARIDAVLPPLPKFEVCDNHACCLEKGHAGECDDGIPF